MNAADAGGRLVAAKGGDAVAWRLCHVAASRFKEPRAPKGNLSHADGGPGVDGVVAASPRLIPAHGRPPLVASSMRSSRWTK
jgi:hypothetical protein